MEKMDETKVGAESLDPGDNLPASQSSESGNEPASEPSNEGPTSMLEAIEQGLQLEDEEGAGSQASAEPKGEVKTPLPSASGQQPGTQDGAQPSGQAPAANHGDPLDKLIVIPKGLKGPAREAYKALADHAQALRMKLAEEAAQRQDRERVLDGFMAEIHEAQAQPAQLADAFQFIKLVNSGNFDAAIEIIERERAALYQAAGKPLPGTDLLAEYPDLQQSVEELRITREHAEELARARKQDALRRQNEELAGQRRAEEERRARSAQEATAAYNAEKQDAIAKIGEFLAQKKAADLDFAHREAAINAQLRDKNSELYQTLQATPPRTWLTTIKLAYSAVGAPPGPRPRQGAETFPLRPRAGGGGQKQPTSMQAAIEQGLGYNS